MFYVYILKKETEDKLYVGFSENLKNRLNSHKEKTVKSTKNSKYNLIWYCVFKEKHKALSFEKYLKHGSGHAFSRKHLI